MPTNWHKNVMSMRCKVCDHARLPDSANFKRLPAPNRALLCKVLFPAIQRVPVAKGYPLTICPCDKSMQERDRHPPIAHLFRGSVDASIYLPNMPATISDKALILIVYVRDVSSVELQFRHYGI